jgi:hypothetical protein
MDTPVAAFHNVRIWNEVGKFLMNEELVSRICSAAHEKKRLKFKSQALQLLARRESG